MGARLKQTCGLKEKKGKTCGVDDPVDARTYWIIYPGILWLSSLLFLSLIFIQKTLQFSPWEHLLFLVYECTTVAVQCRYQIVVHPWNLQRNRTASSQGFWFWNLGHKSRTNSPVLSKFPPRCCLCTNEMCAASYDGMQLSPYSPSTASPSLSMPWLGK